MRFEVRFSALGRALPRPWLAVRVIGPRGESYPDGLLDTGADWTLFPNELGLKLGIYADQLSERIVITSGSNDRVECGITSVTLEIRHEGQRLAWLSNVAVALRSVRKVHWGYRGFLEYFEARFHGPNQIVTLIPTAKLPRVRLV